MPADTVLVIDAGSSALRALSVRAGGVVTAVASELWPVFVPADAAPFGREFDAAEVQRALWRLVAAAAASRAEIAAVAFTGQREGIAFIDERGGALCASPNVDARASAEGMAIDAVHTDEIYTVTGHLPSLMQAPAKFAWLRAHRPELAARVAHVLPLVDWLAMLVTGSTRMSRSLGVENGLLDVSAGAVPADLLARLGLPPDAVPPFVADGTISGAVAEGDLAGVPVVSAGADTQCALVGMAAVEAGDGGVAAGWSAPVQLVTNAPVFDSEKRTWTGVHVVAGRWILESNAGEMGRAWDWICAMMGLDTAEAERLSTATPAGRSARRAP